MVTRREFIAASAATAVVATSAKNVPAQTDGSISPVRPLVVSTWRHGLAANDAAWKILTAGGRAIDAVEAAVRVTESDPTCDSVGYGGHPDRDGNVTLDACIMDETGNCGAVCFLQNIKNPISVARKVMDETPHVMLAGKGALEFAIEKGFKQENLLTEKSKARWQKWKADNPQFQPKINAENHDTIGLVAIDKNGNLSGACTTSGLAYKLHGRVGDSPIIGAGLYVDNEVGAASATGMGEAVIKAVGTFLVVELMRQGHEPKEACRLATERVIQKNPNWRDLQVGFVAIDKQGRHGAYCIQSGFDYAVQDGTDAGNRMIDSDSRVK